MEITGNAVLTGNFLVKEVRKAINLWRHRNGKRDSLVTVSLWRGLWNSYYVKNSLDRRRGGCVFVTLPRCNRCSRNTCEVDIRKDKRKYGMYWCLPSSLEALPGHILALVWNHFGISLVSFCIHFGIIFVSFWRYPWDIENGPILELPREVALNPP